MRDQRLQVDAAFGDPLHGERKRAFEVGMNTRRDDEILEHSCSQFHAVDRMSGHAEEQMAFKVAVKKRQVLSAEASHFRLKEYLPRRHVSCRQLRLVDLNQRYMTTSDEFSGEHIWFMTVMSFGRTGLQIGLQIRPDFPGSGRDWSPDWSPVLRATLAIPPKLR
jgi:hypothetical protein